MVHPAGSFDISAGLDVFHLIIVHLSSRDSIISSIIFESCVQLLSVYGLLLRNLFFKLRVTASYKDVCDIGLYEIMQS